MVMDPAAFQRAEITEHSIYARLSRRSKDAANRKSLATIASDELRHYAFWKGMTKRDIKPNRLRIWWYTLLASIFGVVFALKLMEGGERGAQESYSSFDRTFSAKHHGNVLKSLKGLDAMIADEHRHEGLLIGMLKDERLEYAGSIVLGLNDALVELTGALAGMTLAFQNGRIVAIAGLVTGVAAALSMGASGYLAFKEEADQNKTKSPIKSAFYTGVTYLITVLLLIAPYFIFTSIYAALATTLLLAVLLIAGYTFYIATAKGQAFRPRFVEMAVISLSVAAISFAVGFALNRALGVGP